MQVRNIVEILCAEVEMKMYSDKTCFPDFIERFIEFWNNMRT